jgi:DNA repair exonuclease SbcCD ATPase subunit
MPDEGRHKINCWVPESLWEKVEYLGYDSPTKATIAGYESLIAKAETQEDRKNLGTDWENLGKQLGEAQRQIQAYEEKLRMAPDPLELVQLRTRSEELEKHNESLKAELEKTGQRYDNYMAQMQTLIKQKAIEAPGAKKRWWQFW